MQKKKKQKKSRSKHILYDLESNTYGGRRKNRAG